MYAESVGNAELILEKVFLQGEGKAPGGYEHGRTVGAICKSSGDNEKSGA